MYLNHKTSDKLLHPGIKTVHKNVLIYLIFTFVAYIWRINYFRIWKFTIQHQFWNTKNNFWWKSIVVWITYHLGQNSRPVKTNMQIHIITKCDTELLQKNSVPTEVCHSHGWSILFHVNYQQWTIYLMEKFISVSPSLKHSF